ncbi:FHA domain-containing protein [Saccharopolyspora rhizosphaerae]|uniref:FHA domain-containing protein n=2 Tax=Saccharopolyspora rhizosphaerae TaxID=2492662 RepID=A0A3R8P5P4_9PSEU|nr:FHA domain-containing protein [Saccharopolyspora rhizosphaerae]
MNQGAQVTGLSGETTRQNVVAEHTHPSVAPPAGLIPAPRAAAEGMRLVVSRGPDQGTEFPLTGRVTVIGRHRDCDVVVSDVTASRYHAELEVYDGRCVLVDGGSLNGTYVNRQPVDCVELADGDEIWIGKARFIFRAGAPDTGAAER